MPYAERLGKGLNVSALTRELVSGIQIDLCNSIVKLTLFYDRNLIKAINHVSSATQI